MGSFLDENSLNNKDSKYSMENRKESFGNIFLIKSAYIAIEILSYLNKNKKFELIKYNKRINHFLGYTLDDYKKISNRYIIYEKSNKGKEYLLDSNIIVFEGQYKNAKRNGKGNEYDEKGNLIFDGEYLNGKRSRGISYDIYNNKILEIKKNGNGKEFYFSGKYQFIGQYLNGKRWNGKGYNYIGKEEFEIKFGNGKGKEYDYYGVLKFEGEYKNGKRNGRGKEYTYDKLIFQGEYIDDERNGEGKEYNGIDYLLFEGIYYYGQLYKVKNIIIIEI